MTYRNRRNPYLRVNPRFRDRLPDKVSTLLRLYLDVLDLNNQVGLTDPDDLKQVKQRTAKRDRVLAEFRGALTQVTYAEFRLSGYIRHVGVERFWTDMQQMAATGASQLFPPRRYEPDTPSPPPQSDPAAEAAALAEFEAWLAEELFGAAETASGARREAQIRSGLSSQEQHHE
jgi:hypothetical protein